jgi:hypothetical protein
LSEGSAEQNRNLTCKIRHGSKVGQVSNLSFDAEMKFTGNPMTGWTPVQQMNGLLNHAKLFAEHP